MSINLPMVHVADLEGNDGVNDTNYIVLGQGTDARKNNGGGAESGTGN